MLATRSKNKQPQKFTVTGVSHNMTVHELKLKIFQVDSKTLSNCLRMKDKEQYVPLKQDLMLEPDKVLDDTKTLFESGITKNCTIYLRINEQGNDATAIAEG